jgi:hypothetical protein
MNMDIHRVTNIQIKREEFGDPWSFQTVKVSITTVEGEIHNLTLYTGDYVELENNND